jgi:hypothetical protein
VSATTGITAFVYFAARNQFFRETESRRNPRLETHKEAGSVSSTKPDFFLCTADWLGA